MEIRLGDYRAVPHPAGNCWQLERYGETTSRGKTYPAHWHETGHYPGTLHHAIVILVEYAARGSDCEIDLADPANVAELKEAMDAMVSGAVWRIENAARNAV